MYVGSLVSVPCCRYRSTVRWSALRAGVTGCIADCRLANASELSRGADDELVNETLGVAVGFLLVRQPVFAAKPFGWHVRGLSRRGRATPAARRARQPAATR